MKAFEREICYVVLANEIVLKVFGCFAPALVAASNDYRVARRNSPLHRNDDDLIHTRSPPLIKACGSDVPPLGGPG